MLGKLTKALDKAAKKGNELVNDATRAAQHKVNSFRDHKEIRDVCVESKALPQMVQAYVRLLSAATFRLGEFARVYAGAPAAVIQTLSEHHGKLQQAALASTQHLVAFTGNMEEILRAEQAVAAAAKAVVKPPAGSNLEQLKADEAAARATCAAIKKKHLREAINGFVCAQIDLFAALEASMAAQLAVVDALPDQFPGPQIPYEALYDEPRPALGNPTAKAPPSADGKRLPHEDLALLPRPVDGDTRAKYARLWNEAVCDVLEAHRVAMRETDRWFKLRLALAKGMEDWAAADEANASFRTSISCLPIFENQFIDRHLPEYKKLYEAVYPGLEAQLAPVPVKDQEPPKPNAEIPTLRCLAVKEAIKGSLRASQAFSSNGKVEAQNLYQASIGNLPK